MNETLIAAIVGAMATLVAAILTPLISILNENAAQKWTNSNKPKTLNKKGLDWRMVQWGIVFLEKAIKRDYKPEIVCGISRGGAVLAGILAKHLNCDLVIVRFMAEQQGETKTRTIDLQSLATVNIQNKKVLIVDDTMRTGQLMSTAYQVLRDKQAADLKMATLVWTVNENTSLQAMGTICKPDYYAYGTNRIDYVLPWELESK